MGYALPLLHKHSSKKFLGSMTLASQYQTCQKLHSLTLEKWLCWNNMWLYGALLMLKLYAEINHSHLLSKSSCTCITAVWNRTKGGMDVYSRSLKNVQALHGKLDAQAAVFLRFLKSLLYNAFQTSRCLAGYALLNCPSIQDYATLKNRICAEA